MALTWEQHQQNIFAGESGGDYDALFGYQNRPDGIFSGIKVSEMPIADVIKFTSPSGAYGQYVKGQVGRVATPVGAYQVVGSTLRSAVEALGLDPSQKFDKATQDKIGQYILKTQGTGAWEGYGKGGAAMAQEPQKPQGLLGGLLGGQGIGGALGMSDDFRDKLAMAIMAGSGDARLTPLIQQRAARMQERKAEAKEQRQRNKSLEYLKQRADAGDALAKQYYEAAATGVLPVGAGISGYLTDSQAAPKTYQYQALAKDLLEKGLAKNETEALQMALSQTKAGPTVQVSYGDKGGPPKAFEKVDDEFAKEAVQWSSGGAADAMKNLTQIRDVITDINMAVSEGRTPSGPLVGIQNDLVQSFINPEATDIRNRVQEVVQRNLREILGAQFTQAEGLALIERAYNQRLSPEQNLRRLNSLLEQMATAATAKQQMYDYFMDKGTLFGYRAENTLPTLDELHGIMDAFDRQQGVSTSDLRPKSGASKSNISEADAIVGISK